MRLIDADALLAAYDAEHVGPPGRARELIESAPTVDAIPMAWLDEKFMDVENKDKALSRAAWLVLHAWQNEREVERDGV